MTKESIYELQKIDCNCSDCIFMERDLVTYKKWEDFHRESEFKEFTTAQEKAISEAKQVGGDSGNGMLRVAHKMKFQFEKKFLIQYGNCSKFQKPVSFIPLICQVDTQDCFTHRRIGQI